MRASLGDWQAVRTPGILWVNTGVLALSSLALETARLAARRGDMAGVRAGVLAGGATAMLFLVGQLIAWRQLNAEGYYLAANPANAFFYLITALHGVHVLGGLAGSAASPGGWSRAPAWPSCARCRSLRHLLACAAVDLAGSAGTADQLGRRFCRHLPPPTSGPSRASPGARP
jgi:hypothetical protein